MERPTYNEVITRQNDVYAMEIIERSRTQPRTAGTLLSAVTKAFILGAGGYEGDFDAAIVLEYGGLAVLLDSLGLTDLDKDLSKIIDVELFEDAIRASVDFGASWDVLEDEIPTGTIADPEIVGNNPFDGPIARQFHIPIDGSERPDWLT